MRRRLRFLACSLWKGDETMLRNLLVFALLVLAVLSGSAQAIAPSFELLGQLPSPDPSSTARAVSADGEVVVGESTGSGSSKVPFRWTAAEGMVDLSVLFPGGESRGYAHDVSADGSVVVGSTHGVVVGQAFRWRQGEGLDILPSPPGWESYTKRATGVSADGSVIVGHYNPSHAEYRAFRWAESEGMVDLGPEVGPPAVGEVDVSADGSVIVGNDPDQGAFYWTEQGGRAYLGDMPGAAGRTVASDVSADGSVIVGHVWVDPPHEYGERAFRWTQQDGFELLAGSIDDPDLLELGDTVRAVSGDGSVIVGRSTAGSFIWDAQHGVRNLRKVFEDDYGLSFDGVESMGAADLSHDGRVIVGSAYRGATLDFEAFRVVIPEPSTTALLIAGLFTLLAFVALRKRNDQRCV